jgi:large subunit ribosomal protein L21
MYAIIEDGGTQLKVEEGQEIRIDYREIEPGKKITFDRVLAYRDGESLKLGRPVLKSGKVVAQVLGDEKGPKLTVQKLSRRKNSRTRTGHRQKYTRVRIEKITPGR